ncbi:phenylacetate-CoA oxygenase subunit PaaB [Raoultella terrigena]|uniref:Phenylacetate-CoA oxygenase subunit PaaB n=1 Tax=Raoultella terrigena TaxID=577 RepID=A0A3P8KF95_RAOTE|nr:phenylacetate-CoA oxygenase subunit PaaB [Raoultella terrigena]
MKFLSAANRDFRTATSAACTPPTTRWRWENARDVYTRRSEGCSLWVVKASEIIASQPEERGEFFDPAESKIYRHPTFYKRARRHGTYVRQR